MIFTNMYNLPYSMAVWLCDDEYDYYNDGTGKPHISATSLLKPTKQIILNQRVDFDNIGRDVSDLVSSRAGTAIHTAIEHTWQNRERLERALRKLNIPQKVVDRIVVNPSEEYLQANPACIPVYQEIRSSREINGWVIHGKFDFIFNGQLEDVKTTSTFTYTKDLNADKYTLQGSIYRWLNPKLVTSDTVLINYVFNDWMKSKVGKDPTYPVSKVLPVHYDLMDEEATERFIKNKITELNRYKNAAEEDIPACTKEELWQTDSSFKYYKDPTKRNRATRVFDSLAVAQSYKATTGKGKGVVVEVPGQARACVYCPAVTICKQAQNLISQGLLTI
jgi:hypothetical protein